MEEFFELFENSFLNDLKTEKGTYDFQRVFRLLTLYRTFHKGNFSFSIPEFISLNQMKREYLSLFIVSSFSNNTRKRQFLLHS